MSTGKAWVFGDNVNTDLMAPARLLKRPVAEYAAHCMEPLQPDFAKQVQPGDIVVVTSKVVSKAEGRVLTLDKDEAVERETARVVARRGGTRIVRNRLGLTLAAAGVDASNTESGTVVLLPLDPDASARGIREALPANVAVIVSDTAGRAWRHGQTDIAVGAAGLEVAHDYAGKVDAYGNERVRFSLEGEIDRLEFGVSWNTPLPNGEPALAKDVALTAELSFVKAQ